jgi:hypothetical protein
MKQSLVWIFLSTNFAFGSTKPTLLLNIGFLDLPEIKISELGGTSVVSCMATL